MSNCIGLPGSIAHMAPVNMHFCICNATSQYGQSSSYGRYLSVRRMRIKTTQKKKFKIRMTHQMQSTTKTKQQERFQMNSQITKSLLHRSRVQTMPVAIQYDKRKQWYPDQIHKHSDQCYCGVKHVRSLPAFKTKILVQD
jgi:hypothetical protein